jgi:hypothetical protein
MYVFDSIIAYRSLKRVGLVKFPAQYFHRHIATFSYTAHMTVKFMQHASHKLSRVRTLTDCIHMCSMQQFYFN